MRVSDAEVHDRMTRRGGTNDVGDSTRTRSHSRSHSRRRGCLRGKTDLNRRRRRWSDRPTFLLVSSDRSSDGTIGIRDALRNLRRGDRRRRTVVVRDDDTDRLVPVIGLVLPHVHAAELRESRLVERRRLAGDDAVVDVAAQRVESIAAAGAKLTMMF